MRSLAHQRASQHLRQAPRLRQSCWRGLQRRRSSRSWRHRAAARLVEAAPPQRTFYVDPRGNAIVGTTQVNPSGGNVIIPKDHVWPDQAAAFSAPPLMKAGPFTTAQREAFLKGKSGDTGIEMHHRQQIPIVHGGVMDELYGPAARAGNEHTIPGRHLAKSIFNRMVGGKAQRGAETRSAYKAKGLRLVEERPGEWYEPEE